MTTVFVGIGLPGSGKTTFFKQFRETDADLVYISLDDLRAEHTGSAFNQTRNETVIAHAYRLLSQALNAHCNVIIDATHARPENRRQLIEYCQSWSVHIVGVWFVTPARICRIRNHQREHPVPPHAMTRMDRLLTQAPPSTAEGFHEIMQVAGN